MAYFNYHAKVKKLIKENQLEGYEFVDEYHNIKPALLLHFKNGIIMPIRKHRWIEYEEYLK